ncbi:hypothetical protein ACEYYB_06180 [Paracoccus sp. p4-l81]|uniref:hypothetical protein n=1 Tax=unclassified Paracoccus (in: a-proteobacteria) TaxID=2688777 RepID=UPI0035B92CE5
MTTAPKDETMARWPVWKLALLLYPFVAAAVAINLFLLGLIGLALDLPAIPPMQAMIWAIPLGIPATWAAGRWLRGLMDQAEG